MTATISSEAQRIFAEAPFIKDLGAKLESLSPGHCESSLVLARRHLQQDGFVHAGVQATLADHTAGAAGATLVGDGKIVLSIAFQMNLLRAALGERLVCRANVLRAGRRVCAVESEVFVVQAGQETLASKATVTLAVLPVRSAEDAPK